MRVALGCVGLMLLGACAHERAATPTVAAARETAPMTGRGDRADDAAIWVHPSDAARSLILATNKAEGLYVYDLHGAERQRLSVGLSNNVDVRGDLAVASNDGVNALSWFRIDPFAGAVRHVGDTPLERREPYGVCLGRADGRMQVAVTFKDGSIDVWSVRNDAQRAPDLADKRSVKLASQIEGCVIDDEAGRLFVGEETAGLWAMNLADLTPTLVDAVGSASGLAADVAGVALYAQAWGTGYIVISAQAKDRFVLYERAPPHRALGRFRVGASLDGTVDAVTHTDGLDVVSAALPGFPRGLLVVQDDGNPRSGVDQNFKLVNWAEVLQAVQSPRSRRRP
mgnify:CR=1 FL=1